MIIHLDANEVKKTFIEEIKNYAYEDEDYNWHAYEAINSLNQLGMFIIKVAMMNTKWIND